MTVGDWIQIAVSILTMLAIVSLYIAICKQDGKSIGFARIKE